MRNGEPGPSKTSQYGVDGTEGTEEPLVEADSSAIEVYRESSSAPEQMRSEPRDLAGPSSIGVDRGAPRARSGNEPWPGHQLSVRSSVPNPNVRSGADSEFVHKIRTAVVQRHRLNDLLDKFVASAAKMPAQDRLTAGYVGNLVCAIRGFSIWLQGKNKPGIIDRLDDNSLDEDVQLYKADNTPARYWVLTKALEQLRNVQSRGTLQAKLRLTEPHPQDADLIEKVIALAKLANAKEPGCATNAYISTSTSRLRAFSRWLNTRGKPPIAGRLGQQSLLNDIRAYRSVTKRQVSLTVLRKYAPEEWKTPEPLQAEAEPELACPPLPYFNEPTDYASGAPWADGDLGQPQQSSPADVIPPGARAIELGHAVGLNFNHGPQPASEVLIGELNRRGMAPSLFHPAYLMIHGQPYIAKVQAGVWREVTINNPGGKNVVLTPGCGELGQQSRPRVEHVNQVGPSGGFRPELEPRRDRHIPLGPDQSEGTAFGSGIRPQGLLDPFGQAGLQEPARSSSTWSANELYFDRSDWEWLRPLLDLPSTPEEMRDDAQSRPVLSPAGRPPFFIGPSGKPQELEDIGYLVGEDWQHGSQPVPEFLLDVLDNRMLLPSSQMAPQPISINGETYSIALGPRGRRDAQLIHHPGPSSVPEARIGASRASASASDRSGRVLGAGEWLVDAHIQRDYELLSHDLRQSNPNLAARTQFVDPSVSHLLRETTDEDARRDILQGFDTADFLFIPVNDGRAHEGSPLTMSSVPQERGTHWSLMFVDRRQRENPVAYHYDSYNQYNYDFARRLADFLPAKLHEKETPTPMATQQNHYDCGVFVVDATRALVDLLARGVRPDHGPLDLKHLVADRQALQERLKHSG